VQISHAVHDNPVGRLDCSPVVDGNVDGIALRGTGQCPTGD
jgi:hypothetical protein